MENVEFLLPDDATVATAIDFTATAGVATAAQTEHVWYRRGLTGATARNCSLLIRVWDVATSSWKTEGLEPLNRAWFRVRLVGSANPGNDPAFSPQTTGWTTLGSGRRLLCDDFVANSARYAEVMVRAPLEDGASPVSFTYQLALAEDDTVIPIPEAVSAMGCGVLTGVNDVSVREFVDALVPVTAGTDTVTTPARTLVWDGVESGLASCAHVFTALDVASATLASGEEYKALVYQQASGDTLVIKGAKALAGASVAPSLPVDSIRAYLVTVPYGLAIGDGNISLLTVASRFAVRAGTGLACIVGGGRAISPGSMLRRSDETTLPLDPSVTTPIYLTPSATFVLAAEVGALYLADVTTDGAGVTGIVDRRTFVGVGGQKASDTITGPHGAKRITECRQELITLTALSNPAAGDLLPAGSIIECVDANIVDEITGAPVPSYINIGDGTDAGRFSSGWSTMTAGSAWHGMAHHSPVDGTIHEGETSGATLFVTLDQIPTGGSVRVTVWLTRYVLATS